MRRGPSFVRQAYKEGADNDGNTKPATKAGLAKMINYKT